MIIYEPFWETLKQSNETTYTLIKNHGISSNTLCRLRKNESITMVTLNDLCRILNCRPEQIIRYIPDKQTKTDDA